MASARFIAPAAYLQPHCLIGYLRLCILERELALRSSLICAQCACFPAQVWMRLGCWPIGDVNLLVQDFLALLGQLINVVEFSRLPEFCATPGGQVSQQHARLAPLASRQGSHNLIHETR